MSNVEITKFVDNKNNNDSLFRLTSDNKDIYIKIENIYLPFNFQKYNNNYYINAEVSFDEYDKIQIINIFESVVKNNAKIEDKNFVSIIKKRQKTYHIKLMLKRHGKEILIDKEDDIDLERLSEYHRLKSIYDIVIKPEILWELNGNYGIIFYLCKINSK